MTDSMWALARASRCPRQRFQAWKAPLRCVCFLSRRATVCSSRAVLYLSQVQDVSWTVLPGVSCVMRLSATQRCALLSCLPRLVLLWTRVIAAHKSAAWG